MENVEQAPAASVVVARDLNAGDLKAALAAGSRDFLACPIYGMAISAIYVISGLAILYALMSHGEVVWLVPAAACFPLLAPFTAVSIYEVSRRREASIPVTWGAVLTALRGRGDDQILGMGVIVFVIFAFWVMLAHAIFYMFLSSAGMTTESLAFFATNSGLVMLLVGGAVGGAMALAFYAISVMSLPMLIDRDVDLITAMIASMTCVKANPGVMLGWAVLIAVTLTIAALPVFVGLLFVLPCLGHASWHLYRRAIS